MSAAESWRSDDGRAQPGKGPLRHLRRVQAADDTRPTAASFSSDGSVLAVGFDDGVVQVWTNSTTDEAPPILELDSVIRALSVSPDGRLLAVGSDQGEVLVLQLGSDVSPTRVMSLPIRLVGLAFSPDGRFLAVATRSSVLLWHAQRREIVAEGAPRMRSTQLEAIQFTASGEELIVVAKVVEPAPRWVIRSWSPQTLELIREWAGSATEVDSVSATLDGQEIFWSNDEQILSARREGSPGEPTPIVPLEWGTRSAVEATTGRAAAAPLSGPIEVFDLRDGRRLASYASAPFGNVISLALSRDGSLVASFMADSSVLLWELASDGAG